MKVAALLGAAFGLLLSLPASAGSLAIDLTPDPGNAVTPKMGDNLRFQMVIRNDATTPVEGVIAWISLVQIDKGKERPVDLEDWSEQRAVTAASLPAGQSLRTVWPVRLIQAGTYRMVVSAVSRDSTALTASPFADFTVRQKPVIESRRVLPIALGMPLLLGGLAFWRRRSG